MNCYVRVVSHVVLFGVMIMGGGNLSAGDLKNGYPDDKFEKKRMRMVADQLRTRGIKDERLLKVMGIVERERFVNADMKPYAYDDGPLPIGYDQTISQPYIVAAMTEFLNLQPTDKVLEIGTGSGYQTAVLAKMAGQVYTMEIIDPLQKQASELLNQLGYRNIHYRIGNGWNGWPEEAPFDKIIVTAAAERMPESLVRQLAEKGRIIIPIGVNQQDLVEGIKRNGHLQTLETIPVRFVPLIHREEGGQDHGQKG